MAEKTIFNLILFGFTIVDWKAEVEPILPTLEEELVKIEAEQARIAKLTQKPLSLVDLAYERHWGSSKVQLPEAVFIHVPGSPRQPIVSGVAKSKKQNYI